MSVLRDSNFVQTREATQNKFKLSVAGALHLWSKKVPNWNKLMFPFDARPTQASGICR